MDVAGYLAIARRWWLVIIASAALAAFAGYTVASQLPKVYEAEVRVLVGPLNTDLDTQRAAGQLAQTYAQLVTSQRVTEAVVQRLGIDMRPSDLQAAMTAIPNDITRLVTIRITNTDPEQAAQLANAVAAELSVLGAESDRPEGQTQVIDAAEAPNTPSAPQVSLLVILATFAGLLAAISCVILVEYFRDSLTSGEELRELSDAPLLGTAPLPNRSKRGELAASMLTPENADLYGMLTARIEPSLAGGGPARTLLVIGSRLDGSAGIVAVGLALSFADRGIRTALVDANTQHPDATQALGLTPVPDLDKLVAGGQLSSSRLRLLSDTNGSLQPRHVELTVVPSGADRDLGRVQHLEDALETLAASCEVVVITSPPIDRSSEGLLWARLVDAIVLVVPHPGGRRRDVASSMEALQQAGLKLTGTILTEPAPSPRLRLRRRGPMARPPAVASQTSSAAEDPLTERETPRGEPRSATRAIGAAGDRDA